MTETLPPSENPTTAEPRPVVVPDKPALEGLEQKWSEQWKADDTYAFDRTAEREAVYSIDTPPPTVSGSLHVGHVFSYTHTDLMARFQRMRGKSVFYPMCWDDNGLPTERRVQNYYGVRCDPSLPYEADFTPPEKPDPKRQVPISRPNFIELCEELVLQDEQVFEQLWRTLGLSVDWTQTYTTAGAKAREISQPEVAISPTALPRARLASSSARASLPRRAPDMARTRARTSPLAAGVAVDSSAGTSRTVLVGVGADFGFAGTGWAVTTGSARRTTRSATESSAGRCTTSRTVRPAARRRTAATTSASVWPSRAAVGSSSSRTGRSARNARASASRCR